MPIPHWIVTAVTPRPDYTLLVRFADGQRRTFDAVPLLEKPICEPLKRLDFFLTAHVECGTVVWNDEVDIAPEYLYEQSHSQNLPAPSNPMRGKAAKIEQGHIFSHIKLKPIISPWAGHDF